VQVTSSQGPKVATGKAEANGVFDVLDVVENEAVEFCGKVEYGDGTDGVATLGRFRLHAVVLAWRAATGRFAVSLRCGMRVDSGVLQAVSRNPSDTGAAWAITWADGALSDPS
jgi:hypothetical protein